jgi:prepilin-type N-terminal cleavage/methylation domain-containing protein
MDTSISKLNSKREKGFTIVELLIVIVVIAILAAIAIVSYSGIRNRALESRRLSDFSQYQRKLEVAKTTSGTETYPADLSSTGISVLTTNAGNYGTMAQGKGYCLTVYYGDTPYYMTQETPQPRVGDCGLVQGIVAWWPLNGDVRDISGNGFHGQPVNVTPTNGYRSDANTAYSFNGTSSQILCGTNPELRPTNEITVTAWVYLNAVPSSEVGVVSNGTDGYSLGVASTARGVFRTPPTNATSAATLSTGRWYFLAGIFTNGTRTATYFDPSTGTSGSTGGSSPGGVLSNYGADTCQIGSIRNGAGSYFNGRIDDVRIYNRALTNSEIISVYGWNI